MWLLIENKKGDYVGDPLYVNRTVAYIDYRPINGLSTAAGKVAFETKVFCLHSRIVSNRYHTRWLDAQRHLQKVMAKNLIFRDRLAMLFEALDLLLGQEDFWVPSHQNTLNVFKKIVVTLENNPNATIYIK